MRLMASRRLDASGACAATLTAPRRDCDLRVALTFALTAACARVVESVNIVRAGVSRSRARAPIAMPHRGGANSPNRAVGRAGVCVNSPD